MATLPVLRGISSMATRNLLADLVAAYRQRSGQAIVGEVLLLEPVEPDQRRRQLGGQPMGVVRRFQARRIVGAKIPAPMRNGAES